MIYLKITLIFPTLIIFVRLVLNYNQSAHTFCVDLSRYTRNSDSHNGLLLV